LNNEKERELGNVEAVFTERGDGNIEFKFRGFKDHGSGSEVSLKGVAHPDSRNPARVKVRFYGIFTRTYEILDYGRKNQEEYVIIADEDKESLWLLCRKPAADDKLFDRMAELAVETGVDAKQLCRTPQPNNSYARGEE
jgi:lipocalin